VHIVNGIRNVGDVEENPLFWPFPLQGRPLLGVGDMLEKVGFAVHSPESGGIDISMVE
jgi:hypothetical protein